MRPRPAVGALLAGMLLLGCAVGRGPAGPVQSPTGIVYPPGIPPAETRFSQTATLYLNINGEEQAALAQALEGIEADPGNSIHYFLAGVAGARLGDYRDAHRWFVEAERIYPAYELDIEPEREAAWARAFNAGLEAYARGETDAAAEHWLRATEIYDLQPAAHRNLASLLVELGRRDEAIRVYQDALRGLERRPATRLLEEAEIRERAELRADTEIRLVQLLLAAGRFADVEPLLQRQLARDPGSIRVRSDLARTLVELGRVDEASELYALLLTDESLAAADLFNLGITLFRSSRYEQAARAFELLTEKQPDSRDAWFNYANALFAGEAWAALADAGDRLLAVDPLSEAAHLITARARLETGDEAGARAGVALSDALPVHLDGLRLRVTDQGTLVQGRIVANALPEGAPLRLLFIFYDNAGVLGERILEASAPAPDADADFRVSIEGRALGYRYEFEAAGTP
ncbi:MAG: tetratricopeptide repeat protein [Gammaproteobacteria bacterium]|nr:tetratricopeptide repeat protein [Gammaproteobacteria bacterium]MYF62338.1 tetratricopeptide repeat protein [Gammaproteobacteria bacterium]MYI22095.1 tetratricopeptide repeat protein [Gammaproteobacteria bacterium]